MINIISLPIRYKGKEYYSLLRFVNKEGCLNARVTIMNGDLENKLAGHNVFQFKNGCLITNVATHACAQRELQMEIVQALRQYLASSGQDLPIADKINVL